MNNVTAVQCSGRAAYMCAPVLLPLLKIRWAGQCYGASPRQRRSPDAEAVLGRTRANQFDRRAQRRRTHSLRRRRACATLGTPLAAPFSNAVLAPSHQPPASPSYGGGTAAGPQGQAARALSARRSLAVARDTGLPARAKTTATVRARLAAPATHRPNAFIHSVLLPLHVRVGRVCRRLPPPSCAFGK